MGLFSRRPRPVSPSDYRDAGSEYLDYLKACFEWNFEMRSSGRFFPLHISACFGAAHAATALLHSLPNSPYFRRPEDVEETSLRRLLLRMEHVMSYLLLRQTDAEKDLTRDVLAESCEYFARNAEEHRHGLAFTHELLAEGTWENRAGRLLNEMLSERARGGGEIGLLAGYLTEPLTTPSSHVVRDGLELIAINAQFVQPCLEHGVETGLFMLDEIEKKGWKQFMDELLDEPANG